MFSAIKDYLYIAAIVALIGVVATLYISKTNLKLENNNLQIDVHNGETAIMAYEALIKVKPYEAKNTERVENTNEEIKKLKSSNNIITGTKWM